MTLPRTDRDRLAELRREPVSATPRGAMTPARRRRIWEAAGRKCFMCSKPVPESWTVLDHEIQLWMGGSDDDANLRPLCPSCDKLKTAADATKRAKVKRIIRREAGEKKPTTLNGRGFDKSLKRGFDGQVSRRIILYAVLSGMTLGTLAGAYLAGVAAAKSDDYVIRDSMGGALVELQTIPPGRRVVFAGNCASACTYWADIMARANRACIRPSVTMFYHASRIGDQWQDDTADLYRPEVAAWVYLHGGFPQTDKLRDTTVMPFSAARLFWPVC